MIAANSDALENFSLIAPVNVIEIRNAFDLRAGIFRLARVEFTKRDQILRILERQRPQERNVHDAEDGCIRANSEGQREYDGGEERSWSCNGQSH